VAIVAVRGYTEAPVPECGQGRRHDSQEVFERALDQVSLKPEMVQSREDQAINCFGAVVRHRESLESGQPA
jgi:hypothetical protein